MNSFVITGYIVALAIFTSHVHQSHGEVSKKAAKELLMKCKNETKATESDLKALEQNKMPDTATGQCLVGCIFTASNLMKNGKFYKTGFIQALKPHVENDKEKLDALKKLASLCEKQLNDGVEDQCKNAKRLANCLLNNTNRSNSWIADALKQ